MKKISYLVATSTLLFVIACEKSDCDVFEGEPKNTRWYTNYAIVTPYPHWILIDLKNEVKVNSIGITNRYTKAVEMKKIKIEGSIDGIAFSNLGEFSFAKSNSLQNFALSTIQACQFLKITAIEFHGVGMRHTFLAQIDIFGTH